MSDYSSYDEAVQAILDAQTDVDNKYKSIGNASSTLCDVNQTMLQIPDGSVVRNRGGEVIGYDYKYTTPKLPDIGIITVDSNTDSGTFGESEGGGGHTSGGGAGRYRGSYYAGEVVNDPQSTDKMSGSGFVSGLISSAWAGVSALAKFGKNVAADAGEALATFTENFGQNFGNLCVDLADAQADSIRALFGVDNQGNTSMYLDEDTIGALAIQARNDGFFDNGDVQVVSYDESMGGALNFPASTYLPITLYEYSGVEKYITSNRWFYTEVTSSSSIVYMIVQMSDVGYLIYLPILISDSPFRARKGEAIGAGTIYWTNYDPTPIVVNGRTYYYRVNGNSIEGYYESGLQLNTTRGIKTNSSNIADYIKLIYFGARQGGSTTPGISDQTGATIPVDAITGADPHVVAQNLASQYPAVMGTPVQVVVMDDSCNSKTINYYKVPISYSPTNLNIGAPITGGLQVSPSFNPDVQLDLPDIDMDNYIDQIIKILGGSGAGRDVTVEPIPPDSPDAPSDTIPSSGVNYEPPATGSGDAPAPVTPNMTPTDLWHVYSCTPTNLSLFGQWLWGPAFDIDLFKRVFSNPMDAVIGVHALFAIPKTGSPSPIVCGNIASSVSAPVVTHQYTTVSCGSVWLTEYFGNAFDYEPFTSVSLFLPFIGVVDLSVADVMRGKISIRYSVDVFTGTCIAEVGVERDGAGGVLYQFTGSVAVGLPISGLSYNSLFTSIIGMATSLVGAAAGSPVHAAGAVMSGVNSLISYRDEIKRSGSFSGNAGAMGIKKPYLIISRPQPNTAENFEHYQGIPSNNTVVVNSLSGFQRFESIHLRCPSAYGEELKEIESLLKSGVLI